MLGAVYKSKHPPHLPFFSSLPLICALMCPFVNTPFPLLYVPSIYALLSSFTSHFLSYIPISSISAHIYASQISGHILIFPSPAPLPLLISSNILIFPHNVPKKRLKYIFPPPAPRPSSPPPPPPTGRPQAPPGSKCRFAGQKYLI